MEERWRPDLLSHADVTDTGDPSKGSIPIISPCPSPALVPPRPKDVSAASVAAFGHADAEEAQQARLLSKSFAAQRDAFYANPLAKPATNAHTTSVTPRHATPLVPDHRPLTASELVSALDSALAWSPSAPAAPPLQFEWSRAAAHHNFHALQSAQFSLERLLAHAPWSPLSFGSEFRPVHLLAPLLRHHPLWPNVHRWLTRGVSFPLDPLPEADRLQDLRLNLARGNHKSATAHMGTVISLLQDKSGAAGRFPSHRPPSPKYPVSSSPQSVSPYRTPSTKWARSFQNNV